MGFITVRKKDLPVALVVVDTDGEGKLLEIAPARAGKLGAFIRDPHPALRSVIERLLGRKLK
jgi:hypothetical protein